MKPSEPIAAMPRSGIREVMELAGAIDGAIHLETGEPNFNTPRHICEAAAQAAFDGFTKYTPNAGIAPLREALAAKVRERNGIDATADQVVVTSGAVAGDLQQHGLAGGSGCRDAARRSELAELRPDDAAAEDHPRPLPAAAGGRSGPAGRRRGAAHHRAHPGHHAQLSWQPDRRGHRCRGPGRPDGTGPPARSAGLLR